MIVFIPTSKVVAQAPNPTTTVMPEVTQTPNADQSSTPSPSPMPKTVLKIDQTACNTTKIASQATDLPDNPGNKIITGNTQSGIQILQIVPNDQDVYDAVMSNSTPWYWVIILTDVKTGKKVVAYNDDPFSLPVGTYCATTYIAIPGPAVVANDGTVNVPFEPQSKYESIGFRIEQALQLQSD